MQAVVRVIAIAAGDSNSAPTPLALAVFSNRARNRANRRYLHIVRRGWRKKLQYHSDGDDEPTAPPTKKIGGRLKGNSAADRNRSERLLARMPER